ncbi:MAG: MATE family efflux transporter [Peptococcaceae bacterium]
MRNHSEELGRESIVKLLIKFSIPALIGTLVNALYNVVDRIFIGNGVGSFGLAGLTIAFPLMMISMACSMLIGIGTTSLISLKLGEGKKDEAEKIMGNGVLGLVLLALLVSMISLTFLTPLLRLFGATEAILPYAKDYMQIILAGNVLMSIGFGMNNFIRAEGNPKIAMMTMLIGAITNIILDPIFIFVFGWGIQGAALATIISQGISATWVLYYFLRGNSTLKIKKVNLRLEKEILNKILSIGSAPFAMQLAASLLNLILNNSLRIYGGETAIAGMGVVFSLMMLLMMPVLGISQGAQPIIGYNYGAKEFARVKEALRIAIYVATAIATFGFIVTRLFPEQLVFFFSPDDQDLLGFGAKAIRTFLLMVPVIGFQMVGANYFQAIGKPKSAMLLTLSRQVLFLIPLLLILPSFYGLDGVLYAGPIADFFSFLLTLTLMLREFKLLTHYVPAEA